MFGKITGLSTGAAYWIALLALGLVLEGVALSYQYLLDYWPCVLCIHVRIWVLGLIVTSLLGALTHRVRGMRIAAHLLMSVVAAGLLERSWLLLGTERGTVSGSCGMDSGLPSWFALDVWFPTFFKVWEACGYTPELVFGITMAEALIVLSLMLLPLSILMLAASLRRR